jgi:cell wall assembly regulator SMI1
MPVSKQRKKKETIKELWQHIETWVRANAPSEFSLPVGVSGPEITQAETAMGLEFPSDVRESYESHNGSNRIWFFDQGYLMPLTKPHDLPKRKQALFRGVVESWKAMHDMLQDGYFNDSGFRSRPKGPIKTHWWNPKWIPITYNESGDHVCVDLDPAKGGRIGQVIDWWHERGATSVLADSFTEWLAALAQRLKTGHYRFDKDAHGIKRAE